MAGADEPDTRCRTSRPMAYRTPTRQVSLRRWTRTWMSGSALQVQGYHTTMSRDEPIIEFTESISDIDTQYETRLGSRHSLMFGGGYRHVDVSVDNTITAQMGANRIETFNTFLQDEILVRRGVALTLGSKLEYDTFGGWGVLPSARAIWEASPGQRLWAAVSRTHRTPSNADRTVQLNLGVMPGEGLPILHGHQGKPQLPLRTLGAGGSRPSYPARDRPPPSKRRFSADRMTTSRRQSRFSRLSS